MPLRLHGVILALLTACCCLGGAPREELEAPAAPVPPESVDAAKFTSLRDKWLARKQLVKTLEDRTYANDPQLKIVERAHGERSNVHESHE